MHHKTQHGADPTRASVNPSAERVWRSRSYPVPLPSRFGTRWTARALRGLRWLERSTGEPVTVVVPALYNTYPGENIALGWLNEIDALRTLRQRIVAAAKITGWDVFTFHTLHNLDPFFDTTISAVRDTWVKEGTLAPAIIEETRSRFGRMQDYYRTQPRLIENLVFQSSLLDWLTQRAGSVAMSFHVIGTALISALVSTGALSFSSATRLALNVGADWDAALDGKIGRSLQFQDDSDRSNSGRASFDAIQALVKGRSRLSLDVSRRHIPAVETLEAPVRTFWYSPDASADPVRIATAKDAVTALETLNLASWSSEVPVSVGGVRGWLASPLHPAARECRWSLSNYLLATPAAIQLFVDYIATITRGPVIEPEIGQKRLRLSRMKVTGP